MMNYKDIPAGEHKAKAINMLAGKAKSGTPYIRVEFALTDLDAKLRRDFYLSEKAEEYTMDTMEDLEWNGDTKFGPGSFNTTKELVLIVERQVGDDGVERPQIRYVNDPAKPRAQAADNDESALAGLNLRAKMAARKASKPKDPPVNFDTSEEIPF